MTDYIHTRPYFLRGFFRVPTGYLRPTSPRSSPAHQEEEEPERVRVQIIRIARTKYVGKYQSCMVSQEEPELAIHIDGAKHSDEGGGDDDHHELEIGF